jgi:hypothetical protein
VLQQQCLRFVDDKPEELERPREGRARNHGADGSIVVRTQRQMRIQALVWNVDLANGSSLCALSGVDGGGDSGGCGSEIQFETTQ